VTREADLLGRRLLNQKLARSRLRKPADVVAWLGAVQAQDYAGAKWGVGQRANGVTDADVDRACDEGAILRTHVMRPTWHFVAPADIRWLLALTAPRVHAATGSSNRKLGLDSRTFQRSERALERALRGGGYMTRPELKAVLRRVGIATDVQRLAHLMLHAELEQVVCSGPRRGKQFTYALFDERVPKARTWKREDALAELARRYFASHGPATLRDYAWWSGLTVGDARAGIAAVKPALAHEVIEGRGYWRAPSRVTPLPAEPVAHLLPNYDEYLIAYKDRDPVVGPQGSRNRVARPEDAFAHLLVIEGLLAGTWRRSVIGSVVVVDVTPYRRLPRRSLDAVAAAAESYGSFLETEVRLSIS